MVTGMHKFLSNLMGFVSILLQVVLLNAWVMALGFLAYKLARAYSTGYLWNGTVFSVFLGLLFAAGLMVLWNGDRGLLGAWNKAELHWNEKLFGKVY